MTTALDPVMRACGGVWVAHGSGDADKDVSDESGRVRVPPDDESYVLRRVWLTKDDEEGYYYGLSNSTLWPLCHQVFCRPTFDPAHWDVYRKVNEQFAAAVLEEAGDEPGARIRTGLPFRAPAEAPEERAAGSSGGALLAHPLAQFREVASVPVGGRDTRWDAR